MIFSSATRRRSREDEPRHAGGCLVRPAEGEPDLVLRGFLGGVVGDCGRGSGGSRPAGRDAPSSGRSDGTPGALKVCEDVGKIWMPLAPSSTIAGVASRTASIHVVHVASDADDAGNRSDILPAQLGEPVVRDARELGRLVRRPQHLDRRIGEREHLPQAVNSSIIPQSCIDIHSVGSFWNAVSVTWPGTSELRRSRCSRHEMIEDVDDHAESLQSIVI